MPMVSYDLFVVVVVVCPVLPFSFVILFLIILRHDKMPLFCESYKVYIRTLRNYAYNVKFHDICVS